MVIFDGLRHHLFKSSTEPTSPPKSPATPTPHYSPQPPHTDVLDQFIFVLAPLLPCSTMFVKEPISFIDVYSAFIYMLVTLKTMEVVEVQLEKNPHKAQFASKRCQSKS